MDNNKTMKLILEDGKEVEYHIILAFKWAKTNKNYIVYTDDTLDENKALNIYASIYYLEDNTKLEPIETNEEWDEIDRRLKMLFQNSNS